MPLAFANVITTASYDTTPAILQGLVDDSAGGFAVVSGPCLCQVQYGGQGATDWGYEFEVPSGGFTIDPDAIGIRFRTNPGGTAVTVSAALFRKDEPAIRVAGLGNVTVQGVTVTYQHNEVTVGAEQALDFQDVPVSKAQTVTFGVTDDVVNGRVSLTGTADRRFAITRILNGTTTFTAAAATGQLEVYGVGSGGGGGGAIGTGVSQTAVAAGGGGGSASFNYLSSNIGTHTVAVGVGGTGGNNTGAAAGAGNVTTFADSLGTIQVQGNGGNGAPASAGIMPVAVNTMQMIDAGTGGTGGVGFVHSGTDGHPGFSAPLGVFYSGGGGPSGFGYGGGPGVNRLSSNGNAGTIGGGGGGGACNAASQAGRTGPAGGNGVIYVLEHK